MIPEPFTITATAFSITLGTLGLIVSSLSTLNDLKTAVEDFRIRLPILVRALKRCQEELTAWDALWCWGLHHDDPQFNKRLWGTNDKFLDIYQHRLSVHTAAQKLNSYVQDSLELEGKGWTGQQWMKVRFGLFSESTLRTRIEYLEKAITNLKRSSESRGRELNDDGTPDGTQASVQLVDLETFGQALWDLRNGSNWRYSEWALELRPVGLANQTNVLKWKTFTQVHIWISFHVPGNTTITSPSTYHRVSLDYTLGAKGFEPRPLENLLAHNTLPRAQPRTWNHHGNPRLSSHSMPTHKSRTFRDLFVPENFFAQSPVYQSWTGDLAHLLASLTNWSGLLWNTDWTTNLCTSGIRYVKETTDADSEQVLHPCLHTLSLQGDHRPNGEDCKHGQREQKLRNLGLVLAELICANPFRLGTNSPYEIRQVSSASWIPVSTNGILDEVWRKTRSKGLKDAVLFCLEPDDAEVGTRAHAVFLRHYTEEVIKP